MQNIYTPPPTVVSFVKKKLKIRFIAKKYNFIMNHPFQVIKFYFPSNKSLDKQQDNHIPSQKH